MKNYMHVWTGSVDTEENWVCEVTDEELEERFAKGTTKQEAFDEYCREGVFVEVVEGATGWIDADNAVTLDGEIRDIDDISVYMDDEIRERVHRELAPCKSQDFLDRYCKCHEEKFGEKFTIN